ncbi:MAG: glycosyltransferase [Candidatus Micrarchaeota archaeon]|nr:glycosyltransferase [Candidatus Micrarchaeota archaeon]MDE1804621.1 glycosyltransferase [Candidatus Micrarchaeota archaeon]MDE1846469.1 glycosyltransferase [Candidatus Micrarchaeota archaeon]
MENINIAFYSDTYLPAMDGVVNSMLNFKRELEKRGHGVYIFTTGDEHAKRTYSGRNVIMTTGIPFKPYPQYKIALFPYKAIMRMRSMRIDVIHAQTPFTMGITAMSIAKLGKYPLVGSFHTMINNRAIIESYYPKNKVLKEVTSKYLWEYTKFFYRRCDATIVPSEAIGSMLTRSNVPNTYVVPNSVDTQNFSPKNSGDFVRRKLKIKDDDKVVLYVGRASREKRIEILLKAAKGILKKRDDVKFVIAGTGPALDYYKNMATQLKLGSHVKFIGFVEQQMLPKVYAACDVFCIPSTFETQGIVALEAMASGKPVVGADYLALKELIVNGKNGEKFAPGDYQACAKKIEKALNNSSTYKQRTVETARSFAIDRATDKLLDVYNLLLNNN